MKPALEIVFGKLGKKPKEEPEGDDTEMSEETEDYAKDAKREALGRLAAALGVEVQDEDAALEALEELIVHCSED
jgi:hypothetical protein